MTPRGKRYRVRGRVQGVGYRYFTLSAAKRLGVCGYVRNLPDGDVEVCAEADPAAMENFKQELQRGPWASRVTEIIEEDAPVTGHWSSFSIRG